MDCYKWDTLLSSMVLQISNVLGILRKSGFCGKHGAIRTTTTETLNNQGQALIICYFFPSLLSFTPPPPTPIQGWRLTGDRFSDELGWSLHQLPSGVQRLLDGGKKSNWNGVNHFPVPLMDIIHDKHGNTHSYTHTYSAGISTVLHLDKNKTQTSVPELREPE